LNLVRNKYKRYNSPCKDCKKTEKCITEKCKKWEDWNKRNQAKKDLMECYDGKEVKNNNYIDINEEIYQKDLIQYLSDKIPVSMRADFHRFLEDVEISKKRRENLINTCKKILSSEKILFE
jgi:hypothetical protein